MFRYKLLLIDSLYFELTDTPKDKESYDITFKNRIILFKKIFKNFIIWITYSFLFNLFI